MLELYIKPTFFSLQAKKTTPLLDFLKNKQVNKYCSTMMWCSVWWSYVSWWRLASCLVLMLFRESGRKRKKREEGGSLSASACVTRSVVSGGRRRGGSVRRPTRWRDLRSRWRKTRTKWKKNQKSRFVLQWFEAVSSSVKFTISHDDFVFILFLAPEETRQRWRCWFWEAQRKSQETREAS